MGRPLIVGNWTLTTEALVYDNEFTNYPIGIHRVTTANFWGWVEQLNEKFWCTPRIISDFHYIYGRALKEMNIDPYLKN